MDTNRVLGFTQRIQFSGSGNWHNPSRWSHNFNLTENKDLLEKIKN